MVAGRLLPSASPHLDDLSDRAIALPRPRSVARQLFLGRAEQHRVGGRVTPPVRPHHRAYGSVHGGSSAPLQIPELSQKVQESPHRKQAIVHGRMHVRGRGPRVPPGASPGGGGPRSYAALRLPPSRRPRLRSSLAGGLPCPSCDKEEEGPPRCLGRPLPACRRLRPRWVRVSACPSRRDRHRLQAAQCPGHPE